MTREKKILKVEEIHALSKAEDDEIKSHYYNEIRVNIKGFGDNHNVFNQGGRDCFLLP